MAGMPQRPAAAFLALLIALSAVGPVAASGSAIPRSDGAAPASDGAAETHGRPDATGRYIVMLRDGADTAAVVDKVRKRDAVRADRSFAKALKGFTAKLDARQKRQVAADPNVVAVVPDEVTEMTAQIVPTSISRIGARPKDISRINTASAPSKTNVDADVAILDTGITSHPDLNLAGGYNCSTTDRSAWRDKNKHGTHVAGTVAAYDNGFGVVGVAPGARVWGVKILNDDGYGLLSWYVCGLDWVLAQKDPNDASRPLFEAVNMSVTKAGSDDHNCGYTVKDVLHRAVCRVVAGGITIVAAAANDRHNANANIPASYDEVITVSALADTDGKPGGLGGNRCFSWGGYDQDDTFADFSNYGADVDIIAPGKCIWSTVPGPSYQYLSGTSMAAPAVSGAVALYKASRPKATPAEVKEALRYLGNSNWKTSTDPDSVHEPLLDVSRIWALGDFDIGPTASAPVRIEAGTGSVPITVERTETFFERVRLSVTSVPEGWTASVSPTSLMGWTATKASITYSIPAGTPLGTYEIGIKGTNQGRTVASTVTVEVVQDQPTAKPPVAWVMPNVRAGFTSARVIVSWPRATDPTSAIGGYEVEVKRGDGEWGGTVARTATQLSNEFSIDTGVPATFRVRARDTAGNWSDWATAAAPTQVFRVDDRSRSIVYRGTWTRRSDAGATSGTITTSSSTGSYARLSFNGRGISFVAPRSSGYGYAEIAIDGVIVKHVLLSAKEWGNRWVVFDRRFPSFGNHTILVRVYGGTIHKVGIDAFLVTK
jgi:subtilisin family serine protease